jgi:hypothetical protein
MATVKVSKETYERLNELAGELRVRLHRPVSMDEVLDSAMKAKSPRPSDFAGTFVTTDREVKEISRELSRFWSRCRPPRGTDGSS